MLLTITQSDPANGLLSDPNPSSVDNSFVDGNVFGVWGTADQLNAVLASLRYTLNSASGADFAIRLENAAGIYVEEDMHVADASGSTQTGTSGDDLLSGASANDHISGARATMSSKAVRAMTRFAAVREMIS